MRVVLSEIRMCILCTYVYITCRHTQAYDKLCTILTMPALLTDIKKLSPKYQTSSDEGYHSVITHFAPKLLSLVMRGWLAGTHVCHFGYLITTLHARIQH